MHKSLLLLPAILLSAYISFGQPITFDWSQHMGGRPNNATNVTISKDASGNLYVMGEFTGTRSFDLYTLTATGNSEIFVAKYSSSGACQWAVKGGAGFSTATAGRVSVSGNAVFITGSFTSFFNLGTGALVSTGGSDIFIGSLSAADGSVNWLDKAGGIYDDNGLGISATASGAVYLCGTFTGTATFGSHSISTSSPIDNDAYYAFYNVAGTCAWARRIGNTDFDRANFIQCTPFGTAIITGSFEGAVTFGSATLISAGYSDYFLISVDQGAGNVLWAAQGSSENNDVGYSVSLDPAGNVYSTGYVADTATFGGITINNDGNVNIFIAKHTVWGVCEWVRMAGSLTSDVGYVIVTDAGGSSYLAGYITGNANFSGTMINAAGGSDGFIAKYSNAGTLRWVNKLGVGNTEQAKSVALDAAGFCYVAGEFDGTLSMGTLPPLVADVNSFCVFLVHLGGGTVGVEESLNESTTIYPNPANDQISLQITGVTDDAFTLELVDASGRVVYARMLNQEDIIKKIDIDTHEMPSGIYFLNISSSSGDVSRRVSIIHN